MTPLHRSLALLSAGLSLAGSACAQSGSEAVLHAKTRIVVLDVGVVDAQGNPVRGLQQADFTVKENGQPQTIAHFEAHNSLSAAELAALPQAPKMEPGLFTNYTTVPANGALTVLLLDAVNTPVKDQGAVRQAMLKYLDAPHPGTQIAIFSLGRELRMVQGFTSDVAALRASITDMKNLPQPSMFLNDAVNGDDTPPPEMNPSSGRRRSPAASASAQVQTTMFESRVDDTLTSMNALARYLGTMPGRKNLLWISGSFAVSQNMQRLNTELQETTALFARNHVAVYPVDARGLMPGPNAGPRRRQGTQAFADKTNVEHTDMQELADQTGGKAFVDTNDLAEAIGQVVDDGANFYSLTYTPANRDWKGEFRKLQVQLAKAGYKLSYRPGYYAVDDDQPKSKKAVATAPVVEQPEGGPINAGHVAMLAAMEHGMPNATDIIFKASIAPVTGKPEKAIAAGNVMSNTAPSPYVRYAVWVAAMPNAFTFTRTTPGHIHMAAELVTRVYSSQGTMLDFATLAISREIDDELYLTILRDGMQWKQEISVPAPGKGRDDSFLRIGLHDIASGRVGAIEVPVASVAALKPKPPATAKQSPQ